MDLIGFLLIFIIILILVTIYSFKIKNHIKIDFQNLFNLGIIWILIGIIIKNYILGTLGIIFIIVGISNRIKWEKNRRTLKEIFNLEKKLQFYTISIALGLLIMAIFIYFLSKY